MFLFQNVNCSSWDRFWAGRDFIEEKQEKTKNKINYFVFIIIIDPSVYADMQISKREVRNLDFLLSLFIVGILSLKSFFINFQKSKKFDVTKFRKYQIQSKFKKV